MTIQGLISKANHEIDKAKLILEQKDLPPGEIQRQNDIIHYWQETLSGIHENL